MAAKKKMIISSAFLVVFALFSIDVLAADYYVRDGSGYETGCGANWTYACEDLNNFTSGLTRNATYYIADGNYSSYTVDDAENETQYIIIKKATIDNHGTDTGWDYTYGDGQAVFTYPIDIKKSYVIFDGVVGNGSRDGVYGSGSDPDSYGFKVIPPNNCWDILTDWTPATGNRTGIITELSENMINDSSQNFTYGDLSNKYVCITHESLYKCYIIRGNNNATTIPIATCRTMISDGFQVGDAYELKTGYFYGVAAPPTGQDRDFSNIQISHIAIVGCGYDYRAITQYGLYGVAYTSRNLTNMTYSYNYVSDTGTNIMTRGWTGEIFNNYLDNQYTGCDYELHGQQMSTGGDNVNVYNNIFRNSCLYVLAAHVATRNWSIFNNIVIGNFPNCTIDSVWAGTPGTGENNYLTNYKIHHNAHINITVGGRGVVYVGNLTNPDEDKALFYNNLFYNSTNIRFTNYLSNPDFIIHQYNAFYDSTGINYTENNTAINTTGDPFINSSAGNYHLKSDSLAIDAGINLSNEFATDFEGIIRPQGSGWDIGAYEYDPCSNGANFTTLNSTHIQVCNCNQTQVQAAMNNATNGMVVLVPGGVCVWNSTVLINKPLSLIGAGINNTVIIDNTSTGFEQNAILINSVDNNFYRISGFTFNHTTSSDYQGVLQVKGNGSNWRIDNVDLSNANNFGIYVSDLAYGLIDHCLFTKGGIIVNGQNTKSDTHWNKSYSFGSSKSVFVEDCVFNYPAKYDSAIQAVNGVRYVFRYNVVNNTVVDAHGADSSYRSTAAWEVYNNLFGCNLSGCANFVYMRGGTGVVYNNNLSGNWTNSSMTLLNFRSCFPDYGVYHISNNNSCNGTQPIDGNEDPSGYPCKDQIGIGPSLQTKTPVYEWNNYFKGSEIDYNVSATCSEMNSHIQQNRDYYNDIQKPGYAAFDYPHPLVSGIPGVSLLSPEWNHSTNSTNITFNCSAIDSGQLNNITLYINSVANETRTINGTYNESSFTKTLSAGSYAWNCYACDVDNNCDLGNINHSLTINSASSNLVQLLNNQSVVIVNYSTIQDCADVVIAGQTCLIHEGVYSENIIIDVDGSNDNPITFRGYSGENVIINANGGVGFKIGSNAPQNHGRSFITIKDLEITNAYDGIRSVWAENNGSDNLLLQNLIIHNNSMTGIYLGGRGENWSIINLTVYDVGDHCLKIAEYNISNVLMENNTLYDCGFNSQTNESWHPYGIQISYQTTDDEVKNITIRNNLINHTKQAGINVNTITSLLEIKNNIIENSWANTTVDGGTGMGGIQFSQVSATKLFDIKIINNTIKNSNWRGISLSVNAAMGSSYNISRNLIYNNNKDGVYVNTNASAYVIIDHNTFYNNSINSSYSEISLGYKTTSNISVKNNIFYHSQNNYIINSMRRVFNDTYDYNLYWKPNLTNTTKIFYFDQPSPTNYTLTELRTILSQEANGVIGDPLFENETLNDLHLTSSSPAINAADDGTDIGAYEYVPICEAINGGKCYYVDYLDGNNTNSGLDDDNAKKTIPTSLNPGDIVYLKKGVVYNESYTFQNSGTQKAEGIDGIIGGDGLTFSSATANFSANNVSEGDMIFLNGEGLFTITDINSSSTITISPATKNIGVNNTEFIIADYITIKTKTGWGEGSAIMANGGITFSGKQNLRFNGVTAGGLEFTNYSGSAFYTSSNAKNIIIQNVYIHDFGLSGINSGIYLRNTNYSLIENSTIINIGVDDGSNGDDGIGILSNSNYVTIQNMLINHTQDDGIQFAACNRCHVLSSEISNCHAPLVHSDGIQTNQLGGPAMEIFVRNNKIHDNGNNFMLEDAYYHIYNNMIYSTTDYGNYGMQIGQLCHGEILNNIFKRNTYSAIRIHTTSGLPPSSPTIIRNNIFFDNSKTGETNTQEISVEAAAVDENSSLDHNVYIRKIVGVDNDKIVGWNGTSYTLSESQALGFDNGSKKCTAAGCDWTWQNPYLFIDESNQTPNFTTYMYNSPQVDAGADLSAYFTTDFDGNARPQGSAWDIGAYESNYTAVISNCSEADVDGDGVVSDSELQTYSNRWVFSLVDVSLQELMVAMREWKNGC